MNWEIIEVKEAKHICRKDCEYCRMNLKLAKKIKAKQVIIDKRSFDIMGVCAPGKVKLSRKG